MSEQSVSSTSEVNPLERRAPGRAVALLALHMLGKTVSGTNYIMYRTATSSTNDVDIAAESSTTVHNLSAELHAKLDMMLRSAVDEVIEDGKENSIKRHLQKIFIRDVRAMVPALVNVIDGSSLPPVVASEILKELGKMKDPLSHSDRRWLLAHALDASSLLVKDGAALGLARLADPTTLEYLIRAIGNESNPEVKADLQLVLDEISETVSNARTAESHK